MRNPEDEVQEIAKLVYENWEDNYVKEVYCDVTLALYVFYFSKVSDTPTDDMTQNERTTLQDPLRRSSCHARQ